MIGAYLKARPGVRLIAHVAGLCWVVLASCRAELLHLEQEQHVNRSGCSKSHDVHYSSAVFQMATALDMICSLTAIVLQKISSILVFA